MTKSKLPAYLRGLAERIGELSAEDAYYVMCYAARMWVINSHRERLASLPDDNFSIEVDVKLVSHDKGSDFS